MRKSGGKRIANQLVVLGSAAVMTVYTAGFLRTRAAAQKLAGEEGRRVAPAPAEAGGTSSPPFIEPPASTPHVESAKSSRPEKSDATRATPRRSTKHLSDAAAQTTTEPVTAPAASTTPIDATTASAASATSSTTPPATAPVTVPPVTTTDARPVEPAPPPAPPKPASLYKDGTYSGWGTSRHGDIQASVVVEDGRIVSASISQCLTRYSCSWIAHLPPQVISRQSAEVDYVSGATQSSNAFYYAIAEALSKAK